MEGEVAAVSTAVNSLGVVTCRDSPECPSLLVVNDLGSLGVPVTTVSRGLVVAVPGTVSGDATDGQDLFSASVAVALAEEGTWVARVDGEETEVVFFVLGVESIEEGVRFFDDTVDTEDVSCFVQGTFIVPDARGLCLGFEGASVAPAPAAFATSTRPRAPPVGRGTGRGSSQRLTGGGRGGGGRRSAGAAPGSRGARGGAGGGEEGPPRNIAGLARLLETRLGAFEDRLASIETGGASRSHSAELHDGPGGAAAGDGARHVQPRVGVLGLATGPMGSEDALAEARQLLGVGASGPSARDGSSAVVQSGLGQAPAPSTPARCPPPPGLGEDRAGNSAGEDAGLLARLVQLLEGRQGPRGAASAAELFGLSGGGAASLGEYEAGFSSLLGAAGADLPRASAGALGLVNLERLIATRRAHPEVIVASNEQAIREQMRSLPGEAWSVSRHAEREVLPYCGSFVTLKRMVAILAAALDEGRTRGALHQHAFLYHAYRVVESAAVSEGHDLAWGWPLLGVDDPGGVPRGGLAPVERAGLAAYHRDRQALTAAQRAAGGSSTHQHADATPGEGDTSGRALRAAAKAEQRRKAQEDARQAGGGKGGAKGEAGRGARQGA